MDSTTQVETHHGGLAAEVPPSQPSDKTPGPELSGHGGSKLELPAPRLPPPKVEDPGDEEEFLATKPSKKDRRAFESKKEQFQAWNDYENTRDEIEGTLASDNQRVVQDFFLDGQDYRSQFEAARELVDQARVIIETEADSEKRLKAFRSK